MANHNGNNSDKNRKLSIKQITKQVDSKADQIRRGSGKQTLEDIYIDYLLALTKALSEIDENDLPSAVSRICKCAQTVNFIAFNFSDDEICKIHSDFLNGFSDILYSMDFSVIKPDDIEPVCHTGEIICAVLGDSEKWLFFQKLRIELLIASQQTELAYENLDELFELLPDDDFVIESKKRLDSLNIQTVRDIENFSEYISFLKKNLKRYTIIIATRDTPWGPYFTKELTKMFADSLGLKADLFQKIRCSYAAIIDDGIPVFEQLNPPEKEVSVTRIIGNAHIRVVSRGFNCFPCTSIIEVNGVDYADKTRGMSIVLYDKSSDSIVDYVCFDTFDKLKCWCESRLTYALKKWHEANPDIGLVCVKYPAFPERNLSADETFYYKNSIYSFTDYIPLLGKTNIPIEKYYNSTEDAAEVLQVPTSYHDVSGIRRFEDKSTRAVNISAGHRITTDQPTEYERTIFITGRCMSFGVGAPDDRTSSSDLQRLLNQFAPDQKFIVQNYGYFLGGEDHKFKEEVTILESLPVKPGDIVICDWGWPDGVPIVDLKNEGIRPHNHGELFIDTSGHMTVIGFEFVAKRVFDFLKEKDFFNELRKTSFVPKNICRTSASSSGSDNEPKELTEYKAMLRKLERDLFSVGSIVMNCNPFTRGHRYLIEQAAAQCAHLVIFVVEEDKSVFPFKDRLQLVKDGTKDLKNVVVIPSGRFVLSSLTFSEYFNKAELQDRSVDPSKDVNLFAKEIVPCLNITKRFVGTEPFDTVTKQYNESMKAILPSFGVEVIEIPRLASDKKPVSATEVRRYIRANDLTSLKELVPECTYEYICENFEELREKLRDVT